MRCSPLLLFFSWLLSLSITQSFGQSLIGRFVPADEKIIVFAGGGNAAVGGTQSHRDGYADNVNVPGGVSLTIRFSADQNTNSLSGLTSSVDWGTGPMHLKAFLDSPILDRCSVHLSLAILSEDLSKIASGKRDWLISELTDFIGSNSDHPFYLEIAPEFDNPANKYDPVQFRAAFRRIVDAHRNRRLANVAFVFGSSNVPRVGDFEKFDPGKEFIDWVGYSWQEPGDGQAALDFAAKTGRPAMITRATPFSLRFDKDDGGEIWKNWFVPFFDHIAENKKYIRAISYTNVDFEAYELSKGWGNTRIDAESLLLRRWREQMNLPRFLNSVDKPFEVINFPAPFEEVKRPSVSELPRYKDPEFNTDQRLDDLLGRMTLEEKCAQLSGWRGRNERQLRMRQQIFTSEFYKEIAPHGIGVIAPLFLSTEEDLRQYYAIQSYFIEGTRLGIPALRYADISHGLVRYEATSFPSPIALSTSWNPELVGRVYKHVADEAESRGIQFLVTPNFSSINRLDGGHVDNTFGEDSFLAGYLGGAVVNAFRDRKLGSIVKFSGTNDFRPLQRAFRSIYPSAIQLDLKAKTAFEKLEGGAFSGMFVSSGKSTDDVLNLYLDDTYNPIELVKRGELSVESIDRAVSQVLRLKFDLGLFEKPLLDIDKAESLNSGKKANQLALEAARQSVVLLKNQELLPLDKSSIKTVAVIGPNADVCRLGTHSGEPRETRSLLDGVREMLGDSVEIKHAKGCLISINDTNDSYQNWKYVNSVNLTSVEQNLPLIEKAVAVAEQSDVVILALGDAEFLARGFEHGFAPESYQPLQLTEAQQRLASSVLQTGKPVVLYLSHSRPVCLGGIGEQCQAVLTGHYNGQKSGVAAAEVIFGAINPSGKLTVGWPVSPESKEIEYPFGHGLSYTTFEYGKPVLSTGELSATDEVEVTVNVANVGAREGAEIVQLYAKQKESQRGRLIGFSRVQLVAGQNKDVVIQVPAAEFIDQNQQPLNGECLIQAGSSSVTLSKPDVLNVSIDQLAALPAGKEVENLDASVGALPELLANKEMAEKISPMTQPIERGEQAKPKPNVLFLAVDDMRPELGFNGVRLKTPNIDQLAKQGMFFEKAYCQQASGDFSRLSVMTGLYPVLLQSNIKDSAGWRKNLNRVVTLNQYFRENGYQTMGVGCIYPQTTGVDADLNNWGQWVNLYAPAYQEKESLGPSQKLRSVIEAISADDHSYLDGKRAKQAALLLRQHAESAPEEQPFFMAVGFSRPKMPFVVPERYWSMYQRSEFSMSPNAGVPSGYPEFALARSKKELGKYVEFNGTSASSNNEALHQKLLHGYAASVSYVDACIGEILQELRKGGLIDNTIIVLWGDNGVKLGDHSGWGGQTNLECDTRVPLIICDPRNSENAGLSTDSVVELVDLFPTLCELTGVGIPAHCQGESFAGLIGDIGAEHRNDAFSSFPKASGGMGYSLRYQQYRFSQWVDELGQQTHTVLTDLNADPGEQTNVLSDRDYQQVATQLAFRLSKRIDSAYTVPASYKSVFKTSRSNPGNSDKSKPVEITLDISSQNRRQKIDGFGGSIAFLGTKADDQALEAAIFGLNLQYLRVRGEVPATGAAEHNRELLSRAVKINPNLQIMLSFWQPRSAQNRDRWYWLEERFIDGVKRNVIRKEREDEWATEIVNRIRTYINWGIDVTAVSVQNEPNQSKAGTQSCYWEPEQLALFIEEKFNPKVNAAGLGTIKIVSPELSSIGKKGMHFDRYIPALTSPAVDIASFHMNGGYRSGQSDYTLRPLVRNLAEMGNLKRLHFPEKSLWMTETSGSHWLSADRHTYGWKPEMTDHEKAIKAARYIHAALDEGEVNAFFWWGLIYSLPSADDNQEATYQHRDEGLILVDGEDAQGAQTLIEKTKKFFAFRQYSAFVQAGYQRIEVDDPAHLPISVYLSPNDRIAVAVAINDTSSAQSLVVNAPVGMKLLGVFQTDEERDCSSISSQTPLPPWSVRTLVFSK